MMEPKLYKRVSFYDFIIIETSFLTKNSTENFKVFLHSVDKFARQSQIIIPESIISEVGEFNNIQSIEKEIGRKNLEPLLNLRRANIVKSDLKNERAKQTILREMTINYGKAHILVLTQDHELATALNALVNPKLFAKNLHICGLLNNGKMVDLISTERLMIEEVTFSYQPNQPSKGQGKIITTLIPKTGDEIIIDQISLKLDKRFAFGAEGNIYFLDSKRIIKIYHEIELTTTRVEKLQLMMKKSIKHPQIIWPQDLVYNKKNQVVGFVMPCVKGFLMDELFYGEKETRRIVPTWKRIDLVKLAITFLENIEYLHKKHILVGDIRPDNFIFTSSSNVFFIDTDGFQIEQYASVKGDPMFTPPEMMNHMFTDQLRTFGSEHFAVATLIFKILMMGQNTYASTIEDTQEDSFTVRINKMRFPYQIKNKDSSKNAPSGIWAFAWSHMPLYLKQAFIDTFDISGNKNTEATRYTTNEWLSMFKKYEQLLKNGVLENADPMSVEMFPTRFKKVDPSLFRSCKWCNESSYIKEWKLDICPKCHKKNEPL